jgi:hypothetical protein
MWGLSIPFWETVFKAATIAALVLGGLGISAAFISAWVGYELTDIVQKDADRRIAEADARSKEAQARSDEANAHALEAQLELEKLKAPRSFTPEQQARLIEKLKPLAGQKYSPSVAGDPEAVTFHKLLERVLDSAGWVRVPSQLGDIQIDGAGIVYGVGVRVHIHKDASLDFVNRATLVTSALEAEGVAAIPQRNPELKEIDVINITTGTKPLNLPLAP